jgi:hypothetical protein
MIDGYKDPIYQIFDNSDVFLVKASSREELEKFITKKFDNPKIYRWLCEYRGCRSDRRNKTAIAIVDDIIVCKKCMKHLRKSTKERLANLEERMFEVESEMKSFWDKLNSVSVD